MITKFQAKGNAAAAIGVLHSMMIEVVGNDEVAWNILYDARKYLLTTYNFTFGEAQLLELAAEGARSSQHRIEFQKRLELRETYEQLGL